MRTGQSIVAPLLAVLVLAGLFHSCDNNNQAEQSIVISCDDGVQNGDETGIDCGGSCGTSCIPENGIEGEIVSVLNLFQGREYILTGPLIVRDGARINIQAGVTIKARKGSDVYIAITQGGKIYAYGTEDNPIVFTSLETEPQPGDWGGLLLFGKAPVNSGDLSRSVLLDYFYGGNQVDDTSGVLRYVRVEYAGAPYSTETNFDGITFYGVGAFTTIRFLQSLHSMGNGFSFVGGTANPENLVSTDSGDIGIKIDEGWSGSGSNWFISNSATTALQLGNNRLNPDAEPLSMGSIMNISLLGPSEQGAILYADGGGHYTLDNVYFLSFELAINVNGTLESSLIDEGNFNLNPVDFEDVSPTFVPTNYEGPNESFYQEGENAGAGNGALLPGWAQNWTTGFND